MARLKALMVVMWGTCQIARTAQAETRVYVSSQAIDEVTVVQAFSASQNDLWFSAHAEKTGRVAIVVRASEANSSSMDDELWCSLLDEASSPRIAYPLQSVPSCPENTRGTSPAETFIARTTSLAETSEHLKSSAELKAFLTESGIVEETELRSFIAKEPGPYWASVFELEAGTWSTPVQTTLAPAAPTLPSVIAPLSQVRLRSIVLADMAAHVEFAYQATISELEPRYILASASTNYVTLRNRFIGADPEAWLIETSGQMTGFLGQLSTDKSRSLSEHLRTAKLSDAWLTRHAGMLEVHAEPTDLSLRFAETAPLPSVVSATEVDASNCFPAHSPVGGQPLPTPERDPSGPYDCPYGAYCAEEEYVREDVYEGEYAEYDDTSCACAAVIVSSDDSCSGAPEPEPVDDASDGCTSEGPGSGDGAWSDSDDSCSGDSDDSSSSDDACSGDTSDSGYDDSSEGCGGPSPDADDEEPSCTVRTGGDGKRKRPKRTRLSALTLLAAACALPLRRFARRRTRNGGLRRA